jgi:hypothetical protein
MDGAIDSGTERGHQNQERCSRPLQRFESRPWPGFGKVSRSGLVPVTRAARVCRSQNERNSCNIIYDFDASLEEARARHASLVTRWLFAGFVGPATGTGQMNSVTACPDWSLAV